MKESVKCGSGAGVCKLRNPGQSAAQELCLLSGGKIAGRIECVTETAARSRTEPEKAALAKAAEDSAGGALPAPAKLSKKFAGDDSATSSAKPPEMRRIEAEKAAAPALLVLPEAFRVSVGYATAAAEEICGDTAISSGLPDGSLALILSDGMGKGIRAAALSRSVANRLRKNLKAGMAPANAIKEVNSYIVSHSESENFATVDLLIIDRNTQKAKFYKMGAASSFVLRAGKVRMFEQAALPIGIIPKIRLTHITMQLRAGDIVLMVSDGITEAGMESQKASREEGRESEEAARKLAENGSESYPAEAKVNSNGAVNGDIDGGWLRELLENRTFEELAGTSPGKLARWILGETVKQYGERERDDLTVAVVKALAR